MLQTDDGLVFQAFNPRDVIGKTIVCECGEPHYVEQISYSHKYSDMMLLNEHDEDMVEKQQKLNLLDVPLHDPLYELKTSPSRHFWVHILSLCRQMYGEPIPTEEEKAAASRVFRCYRWEPREDDKSKGGSGLILPGGLTLTKK